MRLLHCCLLPIALAALASCGARSVDEPDAAEFPAISALDSLPRSTSDIATIDGADAIASSGAPSAQPHATQADWLVLDGDQASGVAAWAIWRVTLLPGETPQFIDVNLPQNGLRRYWIAYADFTAQRWQFLDTAGNVLGRQGASALLQPAEPGDMLSPGNNLYVAVLVLGGQTPDSKVNVGYLEANYAPVLDPDPIFDDFEDNDTLVDKDTGEPTCFPLPGPGMYRASIHETPQEMNDPNETVDKYDYYCIDVPAGKQLTVTLRHDAIDFFNGQPGGYNDLDLLFYESWATDGLNDFIEDNSSFNVGYAFEQIHVLGLSGTYMLGIIPDLMDGGYDENALYDLGIFYSDQTYNVNGKVTQNGDVDVRFTVFLEPGNFNAITNYDTGHKGEFSISGVPNGSYTLRVQGTALDNQTGYVYEATRPVIVNSADENNMDIDIEAFDPP